jgi:hypothetical protein
MFLDRWRAHRAIATRNGPSPVTGPPDARLRAVVEALGPHVQALDSLGDPSWHCRWEGELQLVGLDAHSRSVTDVRQRLMRLVHEVDLRHMAKRAKRVLAVVLCEPREDEGLVGWFARLQDDQGEVGERDWRAGRRRIAVLAMDGQGARTLFGGDAWTRERCEAAGPDLDAAMGRATLGG